MADEPVLYTCPCCGFVGLDMLPYENALGYGLIRGVTPPYSNTFGWPSYGVCICCGFEFGLEDDPGVDEQPQSFEEYLSEWIERGEHWILESKKPLNWSLKDQLFSAALQSSV